MGKGVLARLRLSRLGPDEGYVDRGAAAGTDLLGSEQGYILKAGNANSLFGAGVHEADVEFCYDFKFLFDNGDYYLGKVYAIKDKGYAPGYTQKIYDELNNQIGFYTISKETAGSYIAKDGQVFVTSYYDSESKKSYVPVGSTLPLGNASLTSEYGYIIKTSVPLYYFGGCIEEADVK